MLEPTVTDLLETWLKANGIDGQWEIRRDEHVAFIHYKPRTNGGHSPHYTLNEKLGNLRLCCGRGNRDILHISDPLFFDTVKKYFELESDYAEFGTKYVQLGDKADIK